jgi:hypothetical protein
MAKSKQPPVKALNENAARALRQGNSPAATSAAKLLGSRGGKARVARQSAAERSASARNAAQVRWQNAHRREASRA